MATDLPTLLDVSNAQLAGISRWIDEHNSDKDDEARTWGRLAKLSEEVGEVISTYIGVTCQNPRKGHYASTYDVAKELFDVALTALAAAAHLSGNRRDADVVSQLLAHINEVYLRAGLPRNALPKATAVRPAATHRVTWDEHGHPTWICDGNVLSACHWYPDCECEGWGEFHAHPAVPHEGCWVLDWLVNTWADGFITEDGSEPSEHTIPKRDALVRTEYDGDQLLWEYDVSPPI